MTEIINLHYCSFCKKSVGQTKYMIEGPGVCICEECIKLCAGIIHNRECEKENDESTTPNTPHQSHS